MIHISGLMVGVLALTVVDHRLEPWSDQIKDYKIGISCFTVKNIALSIRAKLVLLRNRIMCRSDATCPPGDYFQRASNKKI